jgi:putative protease
MLRKPELLAPAGSWDSLVAAVENGADAVYLGGKRLNARQSAGNFDDYEIARAIEYAHVRGARIYVTVNIMLDDRELPEAVEFLRFLQQSGADAAIVQDLGLVRLAGKVIPELPLHASTQMTVHNLPSVLALKEAGVSRVIMARELSLEAMKEIIRKSGVEIEAFIHGALCICYSGQCLMSSMIGGRSGNRGRCAQPCRLPYVLVDGHGCTMADPGTAGSYILSPRDLNMSKNMPDLVNSGVTAFKIEGRMKRPEYVATVVRVYRALLDRASAGGDFFVSPDEARDLLQIFNRDFTTGYFYGRPGPELMSYKRPNNRGLFLGRVKGYNKTLRLVEIALDETLRVGDGIEVWITAGGRTAGEVNRIFMGSEPVQRAPAGSVVLLDIPGRVFAGDRVFKTHDADLMERARASFTSPKGQRKIPLSFTVSAKLGEPLKITVEDSGGNTGEAETASPAQEALKRPLTREYLEKQLSRLGNTPFEMAQLRLELADGLMVPVSEINEARRTALARIERKRAAAFGHEPLPEEVFTRRYADALKSGPVKTARIEKSPLLSVTVTDLPSLKAAVEAGAGMVYFGGEQFRSKETLSPAQIIKGSEICAEAGVRFILSAGRILMDKEIDQYCSLLDKMSQKHLDGVQAGNLGLIRRVQAITDKPLYADFSLNIFNHESANFLAEAGVKQVTLSPELTMEQLGMLVPALPLPAEVIVHGALPLMVSEYCAAGSLLGGGIPGSCPGPCRGLGFGLKDRKNIVFPVEMDQFCRMHIFNSRDLCLIEDIGLIAGTGAAVLRIEARREGCAYVRDAVRIYRKVLEKTGRMSGGELSELKEVLAGHSPQGFTKGHYYRGVI